MSIVLDASALLAVAFSEPGSEGVEAVLEGAHVSAVNFSEVLSKVVDRGGDAGQVGLYFKGLGLEVIAFDDGQALVAAELRSLTSSLGLGLADRVCLALGQTLGEAVYTADKVWGELELDVDVRLIR